LGGGTVKHYVTTAPFPASPAAVGPPGPSVSPARFGQTSPAVTDRFLAFARAAPSVRASPEPTRVTFVCRAHSPVDSRSSPSPSGLSRRGRRDAARLTAHLLELDVDAAGRGPVAHGAPLCDVVVSGPDPSARQTVAGIADGSGAPLVEDAGFRERRLSDAPVDDAAAAEDRLWANPDASFPGGESHREAQERARAALERVLDAYPGRRVVVGTHPTVLALLLNAFDPRYGRAFRSGLSEPDAYRATFIGRDLVGVGRVWTGGGRADGGGDADGGR
jgi:2,3-bisphosphoglycerate-dependent phosphoglycerate mutase